MFINSIDLFNIAVRKTELSHERHKIMIIINKIK